LPSSSLSFQLCSSAFGVPNQVKNVYVAIRRPKGLNFVVEMFLLSDLLGNLLEIKDGVGDSIPALQVMEKKLEVGS
jgi:hypothetical protein